MPENNAEREPAPKVNESPWEEKRKALLERIRQPNGVTSEIDGERIEEERARLVLEVQRLEEEKDSMVRRLKDLRRQLEERRTEAQGVYWGSEEIRRSLLPVLAQEKDTLDEIEFLESLRQENDEHYRRLAARVDSNMSTIGYVIKKIEFMKGEMNGLTEKGGELERAVAVKSEDVDRLNEKLGDALEILEDLYEGMRSVQRKGKVAYYQRKTGHRQQVYESPC